MMPLSKTTRDNDDLILAMADTEGGSLEYFDQTFLKNWAGPEHWKLTKKVIRKGKLSFLLKPQFFKFICAADGEAAAAKTTKTRSKKEAVRIIF